MKEFQGKSILVPVCTGSSYPEATVSWKNEKHLLYKEWLGFTISWNHFFSENDSDVNAENEIHATTAPRLISTGATIDDVQSLVLAAEGMVVCRFKKINTLSAVVTLLASYCVFNANYPKGHGGHSKNVYLFLEYILLQRSRHALPLNVEAVVGKLK